MAVIEFRNCCKSFPRENGEPIQALADLSLAVHAGELLTLVGPSGCGKTTALRLLAGLEELDGGDILMDGHSLRGMAPHERQVAMVFQRDALFPHLTVRENLSFGPRLRGVGRDQTTHLVRDAAERLGLASLLDQRPGQLSGGERQRVALGRALIRRPAVILLDEPLSQVDAPQRIELRRQIVRLNQEFAITMLHVTHDQQEALALGHRVAVMEAGTIRQVAAPDELQQHPATPFVAEFLGLR